jgi:hypothetical protein
VRTHCVTINTSTVATTAVCEERGPARHRLLFSESQGSHPLGPRSSLSGRNPSWKAGVEFLPFVPQPLMTKLKHLTLDSGGRSGNVLMLKQEQSQRDDKRMSALRRGMGQPQAASDNDHL